MATRPKGYGMTAELAKKKEAKFDTDLANEALQWMKLVLAEKGHKFKFNYANYPKDVVAALKSGIALCKLIKAIDPDSTITWNESEMVFKQMENIGKFLSACEQLGIKKIDLFQTVDLYEGGNIPQVINGIFALGRTSRSRKTEYEGPTLGPKEATENKREFSEEQLRAGESVIGLQAGSNKGASQAGQNFGKTRAIID